MNEFSELPLPPALQQALDALGLTEMTPIQAGALPDLLAGKDVIAQARTGSGKTIAFGLGLLARTDVADGRVQALVLCPTRELADQVGKALRELARFVPNLKLSILCGGISIRPQLASLVHEPHIVVGTPGRILDHLRKASLRLDALQVLVLDEADRMLDMGFEAAINEIIAASPKSRQTLLFSATYPEPIRSISKRVQRAPIEVTVDTTHADDEIDQRFIEVERARKVDVLAALLAVHKPESTLVFCNTRRDTQEVAAQLAERGYSVLALHGDIEQRERDEVMVRFANKSCAVLVATDVAARGLDVKELPAVVNYELSPDADIHLHRIGRTGRAGRTGLAFSLCAASELGRIATIEGRLGHPVAWTKLEPSAERKVTRQSAANVTLVIDGGRKDKLRPGDILGALTGDGGLPASAVGKIDVFATRAYVAIKRELAVQALKRLGEGKTKGRNFRVRKLS